MKKLTSAIIISVVIACCQSKTNTENATPIIDYRQSGEIDSLNTIIDQHLILIDSLEAVQTNLIVNDSALDNQIYREKNLVDQMMTELDKKRAALPSFQP